MNIERVIALEATRLSVMGDLTCQDCRHHGGM